MNEIKQMIEQAGHGNYVPLLIIASVIVFCFSLIILLLVNWYKRDQSITNNRIDDTNKRVDDHTETLKELGKVATQNAQILAVHENEIENLKSA